MKKLICCFTLFILAGSFLVSNLLPLNGMTTIEIAHKLPVLLLPADYTFLLHLLLPVWLVWWIVKLDEGEPAPSMRTALFAAACLLDASWFPLWHFGHFGLAFAVQTGTLAVLYMLYRTYPKRQNDPAGRVPVSLFLAWTLVDVLLNANYVLVSDDWSRLGMSIVLWTILNLTAVTAAALHFSWHYRDGAVTLVFLWVFAGIIANVWLEELFVTLSALFLMALMAFGYWLFSSGAQKIESQETLF